MTKGSKHIFQATKKLEVEAKRIETELEWGPHYLQLLTKHTEPELKKIYYSLIQCEDRLIEIDKHDDYTNKCAIPIGTKAKMDENEIIYLTQIGQLKKWSQPPEPDYSKMMKRLDKQVLEMGKETTPETKE